MKTVTKMLGLALIVAGMASTCSAAAAAPEIDPASAGSALALLGGVVLTIRSRTRR